MKIYFILMPLAFCVGCDTSTNASSGDNVLTCEVEGFEHSLSTTVSELNNKSGDDLVKLTQSEIIREKPDGLTDEELVSYYNNEDNFVKTAHFVAFSHIVKCRSDEELVDHLLKK